MNLRLILHAFRGSPSDAAWGVYWLAIKRRVRGANLLYRAAMRSSSYYRYWVRNCEPRHLENFLTTSDENHNEDGAFSKHILIVGADSMKHAAVQRTIASVRSAFGDTAIVYSDSSTTGRSAPVITLGETSVQQWLEALTAADPSGWLLPLMAGDVVSQNISRAIESASVSTSEASIIYWDEDRIDRGRRFAPLLKPDWDELLFLATDILSGSAMIRLDTALAACTRLSAQRCSPQMVPALFIAAAANADAPLRHLPFILVHRSPESVLTHGEARKAMIEALWKDPVEVTVADKPSGHFSVQYPLPVPLPSVSIVICTRDRLELLQCCMEGLRELDYPGDVEIIVMDNDSVEAGTLAFFDEIAQAGVRVIRYPGPFNFSAINNEAVRQASGTFICLLNNDIEMLDGSWLSAMMGHAVRPRVGAVGALLLYPDHSVQHAGVVVGVGGAAGHVHRKLALNAQGHHFFHRTTRRVSVVTGACLLVRRNYFLDVGGLDEDRFRVAFNDVDFCLKLAEAGLHNIFVAEAMLIHHESKSRGDDMSEENFARYTEELAALRAIWSTETITDPYHHPLWLRSSELCALKP